MTRERHDDDNSEAIVGKFHVRGRKHSKSLGDGVNQTVSSHVVVGWDPNTGDWAFIPGSESGTSDLRLPHLHQSPDAHLRIDLANTSDGDFEDAKAGSSTPTGDYEGRRKGNPNVVIRKKGGFASQQEASSIEKIGRKKRREKNRRKPQPWDGA